MKIKSVVATVHEVFTNPPLLKKPNKRTIIFCRVETDDGYTGYGMTGGIHLAHSVATAINVHFAPVVMDMDPRDTEAIAERVGKQLNARSLTGVVSSALSAVDIACWDIHGKATGRTVAQLLGGCRDWAPTYCTFGFREYDNDQLQQAARDRLAEGHKRLKMVVGAHPDGWREDVRRVRLVRDTIGPDIELMADGNHMFRPVEAKEFCRDVEDCRLTWLEEPLHGNDARALADLRRSTRIPLSAGQLEGSRWRFRDLIERQAVDIVQPNCCYVGGYTEMRRVAHMAHCFNLPIANGGGWPFLNMHPMAGLINGWRVEFHLAMQLVGERIFVNPPKSDNGVVRIPSAPGTGLTPNFDALKETRVQVN